MERENEVDHSIPFLDMKIYNNNGTLSSTWYTKPTDTGLIMNFHSLAPRKYKRSVVSGFVHRIYRACSSWFLFHESLVKAKNILEQNQYPPTFYEPIVNATLDKIINPIPNSNSDVESEISVSTDTCSDDSEDIDICTHNILDKDKFMLFVQYRGKCTEDYAQSLHKINAPYRIVMTLRKLKTVLPSLKNPVEKMMKSNVVYKINCPRCQSCYVGQTRRQLQHRFSEHISKGPVKTHMENCNVTIDHRNIEIIGSTTRGEKHLLTLEALHQRKLNPSLNTKDEYRSRTLTIKF